MKKFSDSNGQIAFTSGLFGGFVTLRSAQWSGQQADCRRIDLLEFRDQGDAGDHERGTGDATRAQLMDRHAEHFQTGRS
jgi:hypothetical protein